MCTLVVFSGVWNDAPLVVGANRDEMLDRPASGPRLWPGERFFAPRDERAGGTWLGLHEDGLFVGITNRAGAPPDPARASRGGLVVEALRLGSARAVHEALAGPIDPRRYNPFHLLYADLHGDAFVTWFDGRDVGRQALPRGLSVVTERSLGGDDHGRAARIVARLGPLASMPAPPRLDEIAEALRAHDPSDRIGSACVHVPELGYGTRASLLLRLGPDRASWRWRWADGPPCVTPYVDVPLGFSR